MGAQEEGTRKSWLGLRGHLDGVPVSFVLLLGENTVGANPENNVVLAVPGISRRHAVITCENGHVRVTDLKSKNGTFVNGVRVTEADLSPGDVLGFGPVQLELVQLHSPETVLVRTPLEKLIPGNLRGDHSTSGQAEIPVHWLVALEPWLALPGPRGPEETEQALRALVKALEANGAFVVQWSEHSAATILHCAGAIPDLVLLNHLQDAVNSAERHASPQRPVASVFVDETNPPLVVAWCAGRGFIRALVVAGNFPARRVARPILELVCRRLEGGPGPPPSASGSLTLLKEGELVFPPGYVPGASIAMKSVYHQLRHLVAGDIPVLISGETGVGKEPIAHILHLSSPRSHGPFVAVNCAAIPTELLEVELFGIEAGVATGVAKREGKFQLAQGGVIFLDEISDMSPALQAKLLRVLQEREVSPVGARRPVPVDVRVISATNADLLELVAQGRFRQDLYFRVAGFTLNIPPLRERREDIPELVFHFIDRFSREVGKTVCGISARALDALMAAPWPGNVRQLENEVRRLVYLCLPNQPITEQMISSSLLVSALGPSGDGVPEDLNLERQIAELERRLIFAAFQRSQGKVTRAAELLGLSRQGLRMKMRRLGLREPD